MGVCDCAWTALGDTLLFDRPDEAHHTAAGMCKTLDRQGCECYTHRFDCCASVSQLAMREEIREFTATGSPLVVSRAIEKYASGQGSLNAIVVPWESDRVTLSMAVTSAKGHGWNVEHTNLGTIKLTDLGNDLTRVAIAAHDPDHVEKQKLAALFDGFAHQLQSRFQVAP